MLSLKLSLHFLTRQGQEQSTVPFQCLEFPLSWKNDNLGERTEMTLIFHINTEALVNTH